MSMSTWSLKTSLNMRSLLKVDGSQSLIRFCLMETTLQFWFLVALLIRNEGVDSCLVIEVLCLVWLDPGDSSISSVLTRTMAAEKGSSSCYYTFYFRFFRN